MTLEELAAEVRLLREARANLMGLDTYNWDVEEVPYMARAATSVKKARAAVEKATLDLTPDDLIVELVRERDGARSALALSEAIGFIPSGGQWAARLAPLVKEGRIVMRTYYTRNRRPAGNYYVAVR